MREAIDVLDTTFSHSWRLAADWLSRSREIASFCETHSRFPRLSDTNEHASPVGRWLGHLRGAATGTYRARPIPLMHEAVDALDERFGQTWRSAATAEKHLTGSTP